MTDKSAKTSSANETTTRRSFVKKSAATSAAVFSAASLLPIQAVHSAQNADDSIKVGLVGTGGRGSGAVGDSVNSSEGVKLVAMADLAKDRVDGAAAGIQTSIGAAFAVEEDAKFHGVEAYKEVCAHPEVDYVIHTTPPGLRHITLREAVEQGKHSFVEKPVCVDAYTYQHVLESGRIAKEKGLAIVSGTQYRRENSYKAAIEQIHDGFV